VASTASHRILKGTMPWLRKLLVASLGLVAVASGCSSDPGSSSASAPPGGENEGTRDGGTTPEPEPSGPPAVSFVGRFDTSDPEAPKAAWPGTMILARFEGTSVSAKLEEDVDPEAEGPSEWDVSIDAKLTKKIVLQVGSNDYELATGLPSGKHVVELYKRSEAQNGVTRFLGFDFGGGKLLAPPVRPKRKIEMIGDSAAAGFGLEGVGQGPDCPGADWGAKYQNFHKAFPANLAALFKADLHGTVYSGKGFARNIWRPDKDTFGKIYPRSNPLDEEATYDLASWIPDVVVIMGGGNDFAVGQPEDDGPASLDEFTDAYRALVETLRKAYPEALLVLALSPSVSDAEPEGRNTRTNVKQGIDAIVAARAAQGDARIVAAEPPVASSAELTACDGHGNLAFHARVANDLATVIRSKTDW
jgi:lysophospholipase L1-like esterase